MARDGSGRDVCPWVAVAEHGVKFLCDISGKNGASGVRSNARESYARLRGESR